MSIIFVYDEFCCFDTILKLHNEGDSRGHWSRYESIKTELSNFPHVLLFLYIVTMQSYTFLPALFDLQKSLRV